MRLDRLVALGIVGPVRRISAALPARRPETRRRRLPILMYHSVGEDRGEAVAPYYRTATAPGRFAEQMRFLRRSGWRAVSLAAGLAALAEDSEGAAAQKLVAVTFDDGFGDFYREAMPVLRETGFGATMFVPTAYLAGDGARRQFCGRDCLTWPEVQSLHSEGIEFGSHTRTHPQLASLGWDQIQEEITGSKRELEERLGCAADNFSYPYAFPQARPDFCDRFREVLLQAGYHACVTTQIGTATAGDDPFRLPRLPVNGADDLALFAAKLEGAYDWMAGPQLAFKALKRRTLVRDTPES